VLFIVGDLWLFAVDSEYSQKIVRLRERLVTIIEPNFGLLNELLSRDVITVRDHARIRAGESLVDVFERTDRLLHCLCTELTTDQYQGLLSALEDTGQPHVANLIRADGGLRSLTTALRPGFHSNAIACVACVA